MIQESLNLIVHAFWLLLEHCTMQFHHGVADLEIFLYFAPLAPKVIVINIDVMYYLLIQTITSKTYLTQEDVMYHQ